jgi:hypothetical protein
VEKKVNTEIQRHVFAYGDKVKVKVKLGGISKGTGGRGEGWGGVWGLDITGQAKYKRRIVFHMASSACLSGHRPLLIAGDRDVRGVC